jgi:uncharacterized protein (TIGR02594 family)
MAQPRWLFEAWRHLSLHELPGDRNQTEIVEFYRDVGHAEITQDEVPWCAAFTGACLERSGIASTRSLLARSYLGWGVKIDTPCLGAITVLSRGANPDAGHVGFYLGETATQVVLLGGNQSDRVMVDAYAKTRLLGYRWPAAVTTEPAASPDAFGTDFETALDHVLEMEGGYTQDPYDPGGPTNKGITLAVYANYKGKQVRDHNQDRLVGELKAIPMTEVRVIYHDRYWLPSHAGEMPAPLALMHFDSSVNHGVAGAAALLQRALQVDADGEIGPITMAAVRRADVSQLIERYAAQRRLRYRSLPHFWRFGRGWLNRVAQTLERARALTSAQPTREPPQAGAKPKGNDMTDLTSIVQIKPWGRSLTIWGALITALSTVAPALGPIVGLDLTADLVRQVGEQMVAIVQAIGGLAGTIMTIYGRARAKTELSSTFLARHTPPQT